jgi:hypothetical protein
MAAERDCIQGVIQLYADQFYAALQQERFLIASGARPITFATKRRSVEKSGATSQIARTQIAKQPPRQEAFLETVLPTAAKPCLSVSQPPKG